MSGLAFATQLYPKVLTVPIAVFHPEMELFTVPRMDKILRFKMVPSLANVPVRFPKIHWKIPYEVALLLLLMPVAIGLIPTETQSFFRMEKALVISLMELVDQLQTGPAFATYHLVPLVGTISSLSIPIVCSMIRIRERTNVRKMEMFWNTQITRVSSYDATVHTLLKMDKTKIVNK
jgi:hypothetical protein